MQPKFQKTPHILGEILCVGTDTPKSCNIILCDQLQMTLHLYDDVYI